MNQTSYRLGLLHGAALVAIALVVFVLAHAQTWLVVSGFAQHMDGSSHCHNHITPGLGIERNNYSLGVYSNSNCRWSAYAAQVWTPLKLGYVRAGGLVGVVTGYKEKVTPVAALVGSVESKTYGLNLIVIPPSGESGKGVIWLQLKTLW